MAMLSTCGRSWIRRSAEGGRPACEEGVRAEVGVPVSVLVLVLVLVW